MKYLVFIVIAILLIGIIVGVVKGFTNMLFETATTFVSLIFAAILCSPVANAICKNEKLMTGLTDKIASVMKLKELANKIPSTDDYLKNINLPDVIKDKIASGILSGASKTSLNLANATAEFIAKLIIHIACFIVLFILAVVVLKLLDKFFDLVNKLPGLKQANKLLGAALGLVLALFIVWIAFALVTLLGATSFGSSMLQAISDNKFLSFLYNNNLPMAFITKKVEGLF